MGGEESGDEPREHPEIRGECIAIDTEIVTLFAKVSVCQDHRQVGCARSTRERPSVSVDAERDQQSRDAGPCPIGNFVER